MPNAGSKNSKCFFQKCYGWNISGTDKEVLKKVNGRIQLQYLLNAYQLFPGKDTFFLKPKKSDIKPADYFFNKLAGNAELMEQIISGKTEKEIRASWEPKLSKYKKLRKKYLLYSDFEESGKK